MSGIQVSVKKRGGVVGGGIDKFQKRGGGKVTKCGVHRGVDRQVPFTATESPI